MNMGAEHEKVQQKERIHENPDKKIKNLKKREQSMQSSCLKNLERITV